MHKYKIVLIKIDKRREKSLDIQKILTDYGCGIKVRLGLHNREDGVCTDDGLIILDVCGEEQDINNLVKKLDADEHIKAQLIVL